MTPIVRSMSAYLPLNGGFSEYISKWGRSLERYRDHKELRRARYPWNAIGHRVRWLLSSRGALDHWVEEKLDLANNSWVFIAGCNNSGTTLLSRVLGSHGMMRPLPREGQALTVALPRPTALGVPRLFAKRLDALRWTEASETRPALRVKYDWSRYFRPGRGHLLVKSPENTVRTRWLQHNFRPSRFVLITRSAYAVCEGTRRRSQHSIADAANHWAIVNNYLLDDMPFLENCLLMKYEEFCESPASHLQQLQEFLELDTPFGSDALQPHKVHNIDTKASAIKNFNGRSMERLSPQDIETINRIAGPVMARLGYAIL